MARASASRWLSMPQDPAARPTARTTPFPRYRLTNSVSAAALGAAAGQLAQHLVEIRASIRRQLAPEYRRPALFSALQPKIRVGRRLQPDFHQQICDDRCLPVFRE